MSDKLKTYMVLGTCPILGEVANAGDTVELSDTEGARQIKNGNVQLLSEYEGGVEALAKAKAKAEAEAKKAAESAAGKAKKEAK